MKLRYVLLLLIVALSAGYLVGQFVPWGLLNPEISNNSINLNDYYTRLISLSGALVTLFATFVALFKEDIKKFYEYASLEVAFKDSNVISEVLDIETTTSSSQNISAKKYEIMIAIHNKGKLAARGCQIYLEQIHFKHTSFPAPKEMQTSGKPLQWLGKTESSIVIPSTAKGLINVVEILSPQSEIVTGESDKKSSGKSKISISGSEFLLDDFNGTYTCKYMIYSENSKPVEFKLIITWNGTWQQRLSEMKNCITITSASIR